MHLKYLAFAIISTCGQLFSQSQDPFASVKTTSESKTVEDNRDRGSYTINVIIEQGGKELARYEARCSEDSDDKELFCKGVVAFHDTAYWRVSVQAGLGGEDYASISVDVEDMKAFRKDADGHVYPVEIFTTSVQSRGLGTYQIGKLQNVDIKVEITKAQVQERSATELKSEGSDKPQPEAEGRTR
jgi:hypothetical protein